MIHSELQRACKHGAKPRKHGAKPRRQKKNANLDFCLEGPWRLWPHRTIQWEVARNRIWCVLKMNSAKFLRVTISAGDILEDWQARTTLGRVSRLWRSCHPFLQLNTHHAEISAFMHATTVSVTVTWEEVAAEKIRTRQKNSKRCKTTQKKKLKRCKKAKQPKYFGLSRVEEDK